MFDDFIIRSLLAIVALSLATAPLGCFVVWRRMAYFGDATAHAAILGVALSLALSVSVTFGVLAVALAMAFVLSALSRQGHAIDSSLGVMAHSALAIGLVAVSLLKGVRVDLQAYLFGDILAVSSGEISAIWIGAALVLGLLLWRWQPLLTTTINPELARASGINPRREEMVLNLALAIVIAVAIKIVGALLISAMLLIPASAARRFSATPEAMLVVAFLMSLASGAGGLWLSFTLDSPAGPSIIVAAAAIFIVSALVQSVARAR